MSDSQREKGGSLRTLHLLTLLALVAVAGGVFVTAKRKPAHAPAEKPPAPLQALDALPAGNSFLATLDLERLRQSAVGAALAGKGRVLPGVGRLQDVCGFDPTLRISTLAIGVPPSTGGAQGRDFGIVATGDFRALRIADCAARVIERRGGTPVRTRLGSFIDVRDRLHAGGEVAVRDGGPVLLGGGSYLRAMVDAADKQGPNARSDKLHTTLRGAVGRHSTLVATWVLSPNWLTQLSGSSQSQLSPLSKVRAAALAVDFSPGVEARAVVGCSQRDACRQVAALLEDLGRTKLGPLLQSELGTDLAQRVQIKTQPHQVHLRLSLTAAEAAPLVARAWSRLEESEPGARSSAAPPKASTAPPPVASTGPGVTRRTAPHQAPRDAGSGATP